MSDTPTPEQQEVDIIADLLGRYAGFTPTADMVDDEIHDLHQLGFRVYPEPGEDTHPTPSHSATLRELEQTRAERDAAVARAVPVPDEDEVEDLIQWAKTGPWTYGSTQGRKVADLLARYVLGRDA